MAAFFPVFLRSFWISGDADATFVLGLSNSIAALLVVLCAPVVGALADRINGRKRLLLLFAGLGIFGTGALSLAGAGQYWLAAALFVVATFGFSCANGLYDSLLVFVSTDNSRSRVSALGYSLGYLGGSALLCINLAMIFYPDWFGLSGREAATRWSFVTVAVWWAVFSIPIALGVKEGKQPTDVGSGSAAMTWQFLQQALKLAWGHKSIRLFLIAYWCYIDGVHTIIRMAVDFGQAIDLGLQNANLVAAILLTNLIGFPATLVFGYLAQRVGFRHALLFGIGVYLLIVIGGSQIRSIEGFYVLAIAVGLVQGGIQAASRAAFTRLIPASHSAALFGLYNVLGKFAAVIGPAMMGVVSLTTGSPRLALGCIAVLFVVGGGMLWHLRDPALMRG